LNLPSIAITGRIGLGRTREIQQLIEELSSSNDGLMMANEHLQQQKEETIGYP
jgi:nucleoside-triphosphatase THEP1